MYGSDFRTLCVTNKEVATNLRKSGTTLCASECAGTYARIIIIFMLMFLLYEIKRD